MGTTATLAALKTRHQKHSSNGKLPTVADVIGPVTEARQPDCSGLIPQPFTPRSDKWVEMLRRFQVQARGVKEASRRECPCCTSIIRGLVLLCEDCITTAMADDVKLARSPVQRRLEVQQALEDADLPRCKWYAVLLAARELPQPFTAAQLVVAAWKRDKLSFGLEGFEQEHPDSNAVLSLLMGAKGLCGRGMLQRVGPKLYRVVVVEG